jgi:hypothetical protein
LILDISLPYTISRSGFIAWTGNAINDLKQTLEMGSCHKQKVQRKKSKILAQNFMSLQYPFGDGHGLSTFGYTTVCHLDVPQTYLGQTDWISTDTRDRIGQTSTDTTLSTGHHKELKIKNNTKKIHVPAEHS